MLAKCSLTHDTHAGASSQHSAWNGTTLSSAGRDSTIRNWDVRKRRDEACVATLCAHEQEVCGLKWSPCGGQLASGGNDNNLCIWDASFKLLHKVNAHQAAVKGMAWCPFQVRKHVCVRVQVCTHG